jgi:hypothetical protein
VCPVNGGAAGFPVATSHRRTVPSCPPVATMRPSGLNSVTNTEPECPRSGQRLEMSNENGVEIEPSHVV